MSNGLKIFDSAGFPILDTNTISARFVAYLGFTFASTESGTKAISVPGMIDADILIPAAVYSSLVFSKSGEIAYAYLPSALGIAFTYYASIYRIT